MENHETHRYGCSFLFNLSYKGYYFRAWHILLFNLTEQYRKLWFSDIDRRLGSLIDFYILWLSVV